MPDASIPKASWAVGEERSLAKGEEVLVLSNMVGKSYSTLSLSLSLSLSVYEELIMAFPHYLARGPSVIAGVLNLRFIPAHHDLEIRYA